MPDDVFFAAEIDQNIFEIDLHGCDNIPDAIDLLEQKLFYLSQNHIPYCKVIHGIGSGRLAQVVHEKLSCNPLVEKWKETSEGGSCFVIL